MALAVRRNGTFRMTLHSRLKLQLLNANNGSGKPSGEKLLELVSSSYEELEKQLRQAHKSLHLSAHECKNLNSQKSSLQSSFDELLEGIPDGILLIDAQGRVHFCNSAAFDILGLAPHFATRTFNIREAKPRLEALRIMEKEDKSVIEIEVAPDKFADIHATRTSSGLILIVKVVDPTSNIRNAQFMMETEYRSLFENAVCGIYRDTVDGTPIRSNPALVAFNGYTSEAEYKQLVSAAHGSWYVDPTRGAEFERLIKTEGGVKDFVSEVYRHRTREMVWITENAWYVRNESGDPVYIEGTIQDATERISTMEIIERQANLDSLTGIASRKQFLRALESQVKSGKQGCTVYSIDLDRFKEINDVYGHATGDFVLKTLAAKLQSLVQSNDLVARLGGDEFAILQSSVVSDVQVNELAAKIVTSMREPILLNGHNLLVGASIGIATFPTQGDGAEALLGNADLALYKAKKSGGNTFRVFDAELRSKIEYRMEVEEELKSAVAGNQLELYYQPIVVGATGAIQGYEALMRWHHPSRGFLAPSQFIQIAEDAGLMTELGNWAIACVCQQASALPSEIKVAVNVSANQFRSASIVEVLRKSLFETKLDPKRLVLEITETVILANEMIADNIYLELQDLGVLVALDDFGTGYSSLSYLQRFKFDKVKIDRTFINGMLDRPANMAIVRAVIGIGRDLGLNVVAEGVETKLQADALLAEGCVLMQGYLYGKPKPYTEIVNDLAVQKLIGLESVKTGNRISSVG
jgi:diguanylate cyclase (GGDEF)-like protein/PAS domain S-box-containing protein